MEETHVAHASPDEVELRVSFMAAIPEVGLQVHPTLTMAPQAVNFVYTKMELFMYHLLEEIFQTESSNNSNSSNSTTSKVDIACVEKAVRASLQPTMQKWCMDESQRAVEKFRAASTTEEGFLKCGLVLPLSAIARVLEGTRELDPDAAVFLASSMEYVCADLLQAAGNRTISSNAPNPTITLSDIVQTIAEDEELYKLFFIVSPDDQAKFMKRIGLTKTDSLLYTPFTKKSTMKLDTKPSDSPVEATPPSLAPASAASGSLAAHSAKIVERGSAADVVRDAAVQASDLEISKIIESATNPQSWETPASWSMTPLISAASLIPIMDGHQPQAGDEFSSLYGASRPLSMSISIENLQQIGGENFLERIRATEKRRPSVVDMMQPPMLSLPKKQQSSNALRRESVIIEDDAGEPCLVRVNLPNGLKTKVEVPKSMLISELLRYVVSKRFLKFEEYTARLPDPHGENDEVDITKGKELDKSLTVGSLPYMEVSICPKGLKENPKKTGEYASRDQARTLYISENGRDVLVIEMTNGRAQVTAGTVEKLVERLADENRQDNRYVDCVLLTYRFYVTAAELFEQLFLRFRIKAPPDASAEELQYFSEWQKPIQRKVVAVIRWWVENYWQDFNTHVDLLHMLIAFEEELRKAGFDSEREQLEASLIFQLQNFKNLRTIPVNYDQVDSRFLTLDARQIATQLTLWDFELFKSIQPVEYVSQILDIKKTELYQNLDTFIKRFDLESYWVATEICLEKDIRRRIMILESFIRIAKICHDNKNFFSMFSIVGGLNMSFVQRLKKTWEEIPSRTMEVFHDMEQLMLPYQNMKNYRDKMLSSHPPIIPVLPVYLKDLLFTHDGNRSTINDLVNFEKFKMIANQVRQIVALKSIPYPKDETAGARETLQYVKCPVVIRDTARLEALCADIVAAESAST